jgi:hypothetical protein
MGKGNGNGKSKKAMKKLYKEAIPVFRLKCEFGKNTAVLNVEGTVLKGTDFGDEPAEFDTPKDMIDEYGKNVLHVCDHIGYKLGAKLFNCNINGGFLINNRKLPIMHMDLMYEKQFVTGFLFSVYVYFVIDDKTMSELTDPSKYINRVLTGEFKFEIDTEEEFKEKFFEYCRPKLEEVFMTQYVELQTLGNTDGDNNKNYCSDADLAKGFEQVTIQTNDKLNKFSELLEPITFQRYPNKLVIINKYMKGLFTNPIFIELAKYAVEMRDDERKSDSGGNFRALPKRIFDFDTIKNHPEKIDEMLNDADLDRSSDEESDFE